MKKKIVIIGGGLAGLSSAVHLCKNNFNVILIEASPKLGGRTYSFIDSQNSIEVDNGQHIMMSCYHDTLELLKLIGSVDKLKIQENLNVNFIANGGRILPLSAKKLIYPFDILGGILSFKALTLKERIKIADFFLDLICCFETDLTDVSVYEWLKRKKQSQNSIKSFWEILCVGIMNSGLKDASAELFAFVLKEIFLSGKSNTKIVIPKEGLSKIFSEPAEKYILKNSSKVLLSERVTRITKDKNLFTIETQKQIIGEVNFVISAVPHYSLMKITGLCFSEEITKLNLQYSPIITVHIRLKSNPFSEKFYGLLGSEIHWLFNHGQYISVLISAAVNFIDKDDSEITEKIFWKLNKFFPMFSKDLVLNYIVLKEKRATFIPNATSVLSRKNVKNNFENLFFAGDWTNTGLPGTIEGAVKSGKSAAASLIMRASNIS